MRSIFGRLHRRYGPKITGIKRQRIVREKVRHEADLPAEGPQARNLLAMRGGPRTRVAIVGAGLSGLMAGYALAGSCQVTVFEARDRFGGRVWSKPRQGGLIEAGAELIGYNHPLWLKLARHFGLGLSVITQDGNFDALDLDMPLYLDGKKINEAKQEKIYREMDKAFKGMTRHSRKIDPHRPWLSENAEKLDGKSLSDWIADQDCSPLTRLAMEEQFSNDAGQPTSKQSYLANLAVVRGGALDEQPDAFFSQTETLRCSEGNHALAECLVEAIGKASGEIRLSTPALSIDVREGDVALRVREDSGPHAGRESEVTADYVVLAIPPSLWPGSAHEKIAVRPPLPADCYVSMGKAVKYISAVKRRFWITDGLAPTAISNRFGVTWEGTDNQIAPVGESAHLSLFAGGDVAQAALDQLASGGATAVHAFYAAALGKVYKGYVSNLSQTPDFIDWPNDQWTAAGYSCPEPGQVCRAGPLLYKAFQKRLFFAGEHTCFAYFGYMEGALQSGRRAARAILRASARQPQGAS
jgi:monoamine oxidase